MSSNKEMGIDQEDYFLTPEELVIEADYTSPIDFYEASKAWRENKTWTNGNVRYVCGSVETKSGKCNGVPHFWKRSIWDKDDTRGPGPCKRHMPPKASS